MIPTREEQNRFIREVIGPVALDLDFKTAYRNLGRTILRSAATVMGAQDMHMRGELYEEAVVRSHEGTLLGAALSTPGENIDSILRAVRRARVDAQFSAANNLPTGPYITEVVDAIMLEPNMFTRMDLTTNYLSMLKANNVIERAA